MDMSQELFCVEIYRKNAVRPVQDPHCGLPVTTFWMEIEAHVTRAILYGNLQEKCCSRIPGPAFCVEIYRKKTHMDMSPNPFCVEIYRKNAAPVLPGPYLFLEIYRKKRTWTCHKSHFVW